MGSIHLVLWFRRRRRRHLSELKFVHRLIRLVFLGQLRR
jgi:hypothetical protein